MEREKKEESGEGKERRCTVLTPNPSLKSSNLQINFINTNTTQLNKQLHTLAFIPSAIFSFLSYFVLHSSFTTPGLLASRGSAQPPLAPFSQALDRNHHLSLQHRGRTGGEAHRDVGHISAGCVCVHLVPATSKTWARRSSGGDHIE